MKYFVYPLFIREGILYNQEYITEKTTCRENTTPETNTFEDILLNQGPLYEPYPFPKLDFVRCLVCDNTSGDDVYNNFIDKNDVTSFLKRNESDWQECGWYNSAHIIEVENNEIIKELFYSVYTRDFVEFEKTDSVYKLTSEKLPLIEDSDCHSKKVSFFKNESRLYSVKLNKNL